MEIQLLPALSCAIVDEALHLPEFSFSACKVRTVIAAVSVVSLEENT